MERVKKYLVWLVIFSIGYVLGETAGKMVPVKPQFAETKCPYVMTENVPADIVTNPLSATVLFPPVPVTSQSDFVPEKFNQNSKTFDGTDLYAFPGTAVWTRKSFDIDGDGKKELIMTANTAMNHTPHIAIIVKDGNVVFKATGAQTYIYDENPGMFMLHQTNDWLTGDEVMTKYVYKDGKYLALWTQRQCGVKGL